MRSVVAIPDSSCLSVLVFYLPALGGVLCLDPISMENKNNRQEGGQSDAFGNDPSKVVQGGGVVIKERLLLKELPPISPAL